MSLFLVDAGREWRESQRQVLCIARELRKKSYAAHLVVESGGALHRKAAEEGLSTLPLRMRGRMKWVVRRDLTRAMRAHGCRLAHFHETLGAAIGLPAAVSAQVPVRILSRPADSLPLEGRLPLSAVDAVIAGSEGVRLILVRGGVAEVNVEVVPLGLDFSPFTAHGPDDSVRKELGFGPEDSLAGVVIPLEDERGHQVLLDAAAIVGQAAPKVKIVVLGEGSLRLESGDPAVGRPMDNVFYFLGRRNEAPRSLASMNMFAVFSHLDGLGGFLIEAMASGLPVVAADVGAARDIITPRETGLLVPARSAKALADAILKICLDKVLAGRLAARGRESVLEKYSAEAMARRIIGIYEWRAHRKGVKLG
ncbi:MAG: glycosyltransferase family 4 protein [Candidatus Aminicenantes bacterium]|nr:glycosyltransferase family 4 protein [Candidatus Aminicenantes bacterium]